MKPIRQYKQKTTKCIVCNRLVPIDRHYRCEYCNGQMFDEGKPLNYYAGKPKRFKGGV